MKLGLVLLGVIAWAGVAVVAVLMAAWEQPVWGFFPILAAVLAAWVVGEIVSRKLIEGGTDD
jgi:hypothetical protein